MRKGGNFKKFKPGSRSRKSSVPASLTKKENLPAIVPSFLDSDLASDKVEDPASYYKYNQMFIKEIMDTNREPQLPGYSKKEPQNSQEMLFQPQMRKTRADFINHNIK